MLSSAKGVVRGRLTIPSVGEYREFMYNPDKLSDGKESGWAEQKIPGASHPVMGFAAGGARKINFTLFIDGDRGRYDRSEPRPADIGIGIQDQIAWYQSFLYPVAYRTFLENLAPYTCLFTMGVMYRSLPVVVWAAGPVQVEHWIPDMTPVRARIPIELREIVRQSQTRDDILAIGNRR